MTIIYILQLAWLLIFAFLVITTLIFTIFWNLCSNPRVQSLDDCIDFTQFSKFSHIDINEFKLGYCIYVHIYFFLLFKNYKIAILF